MYKGVGAGGSTNVATSNGAGAQAGHNAVQPMDVTGIAQLKLLAAQEENIKADTEKKKADAAKTAGVDTAAAQAGIKLTEALTNNEVVKQEINEQIREQQFIETHIKTMTMNNVISQVQYQTAQAWEVLQGQITANKISKETADEQIEIIKTNKLILLVQKALLEENVTKTQEEIKAIVAGVKQKWQDVYRNNREQMLNAVGGKGGAENFWDWGGLILKKNPERVAKAIDSIMRTGTIELKEPQK